MYINSENSKTSKTCVLILKLTDQLDLKRGEISVALSNLSIFYTLKNIKSSSITINLSSNMELWIWITWWIIFYSTYSRLLYIHLFQINHLVVY